MTTHTDAASDPARLKRQSAKARRAAAGGRLTVRILNLRATGMTLEAIAYAVKAPVEGVRGCVRNARTLRDPRALTDKAAAEVTATRVRAEEARTKRAEAAAAARAAREARGRARDEAAALAAAAVEEVREEPRPTFRVVVDEVDPMPAFVAELPDLPAGPFAQAPSSPLASARVLKVEFVGPAGVPDPAALGWEGRQRFARMLADRNARHLADLYAERPTFYPSVVIPSDGLSAQRIRPDLVNSPCGSAAALCVTHG